jgi:[ribosomal protein S5]-alanine N-acetyltransferase
MFTAPLTFETGQLVLRQPRLVDANDIFQNYGADPEVTRYLTWRPSTHFRLTKIDK